VPGRCKVAASQDTNREENKGLVRHDQGRSREGTSKEEVSARTINSDGGGGGKLKAKDLSPWRLVGTLLYLEGKQESEQLPNMKRGGNWCRLRWVQRTLEERV